MMRLTVVPGVSTVIFSREIYRGLDSKWSEAIETGSSSLWKSANSRWTGEGKSWFGMEDEDEDEEGADSSRLTGSAHG